MSEGIDVYEDDEAMPLEDVLARVTTMRQRGFDATLPEKRAEMCRCCGVRAAVGDGGLCARRLCRETTDLVASSMVGSREGRKPKKKAKKQRGAPMTARARREART